MKIDLHVHTTRYSHCSIASPEAMIESAIRNGIDGLVFTEHNIMWRDDEIRELQLKYPSVKLFSGIEYTVKWPNGQDREDILIYGVDQKDVVDCISKLNDFYEIYNEVNKRGGTCIIAHPFRYHDKVPDAILEGYIDGIEAFSSNISEDMRRKAKYLSSKNNKIITASTDGHSVDKIGMYACDFYDDIKDKKKLASELKAGRYKLYIRECNTWN